MLNDKIIDALVDAIKSICNCRYCSDFLSESQLKEYEKYTFGRKDGILDILSILVGSEVELVIKQAENDTDWVQIEALVYVENEVRIVYREINHPEWGIYDEIEEYGRVIKSTCDGWRRENI